MRRKIKKRKRSNPSNQGTPQETTESGKKEKEMSWNYRVLKRVFTFRGKAGSVEVKRMFYDLRKVYYAANGDVDLWSTYAAEPTGESLEDLKWCLTRMLEALEKPVLTEVKRGKKEYLEELL
jgi:hypothetical protein